MPVRGKIRIPLSIENVFKRLSEQEVYTYYIGHEFVLNKPFYSPFRKENNPSFTIILGKNGKLHHLDYADSEKSGDVINFICQLFNITSSQALMKIDHDFNLGLSTSHNPSEISNIKRVEITTPLQLEVVKKFIQVKSRRFSTSDLVYWNSYHVTEKMLKDNNVYAVKDLYLDRKKYPLRNDLCFAYLFTTKEGNITWKIYWPERKKTDKWLGNTPNSLMSGIEKIKKGDEYVIITKSKKDEMVLSNFLPKVISVQSESIFSITEENILLLQGCHNVFINFDNDETGKKSSMYYNQFGFRWINCPEEYKDPNGKIIKDFADMAKHFGLEVVMAYFKKKHIPIIY